MHARDRMMNVAQSYSYKVEDELIDPDVLLCEECERYIAATGDEGLPRYLSESTSADYTYKCLLAAIYRVGAAVGRRDRHAGRDVSMALVAYMPDIYKAKSKP